MQCGQAVFYQAKLHYLPSPLSAVPAAPENVTLTNISSQLLVRWTIDPPNGMISHYTIYVTRVERGNTLLAYTSTNTEFDIPSGDLDPFELVSVSVSAGNSAGEGARSLGVRGRTREERKSSQQSLPPTPPLLFSPHSHSGSWLETQPPPLLPARVQRIIIQGITHSDGELHTS